MMTMFDDLIPSITPSSASVVELPQALPTEVKTKRRSTQNTLCVDRADMGEDPIMSFIGGSYTTSDDSSDLFRTTIESNRLYRNR